MTKSGKAGSLKKTVVFLLIIALTVTFIPWGSSGSAYAAETVASGNYEGVDWSIDDENVLRLGNAKGTQYLKYSESRSEESYPWHSYRSSIEKIEIVGKIYLQGSLNGLFWNMTNLKSIEGVEQLDVYSGESGSNLFYGCTLLTKKYEDALESEEVTYSDNAKFFFRKAIDLITEEVDSEDYFNSQEIDGLFTSMMMADKAMENDVYESYSDSCSGIEWSFADGTLTLRCTGGNGFVLSGENDVISQSNDEFYPFYEKLSELFPIAEKLIIQEGIYLNNDGHVLYGELISLKELYFTGDLTYIGLCAFEDHKKLEKVVFPENLRTIDLWAFRNCSALKTIEFSGSCETINECAFKGCTSLESVVFPATLKGIGEEAFSGCTSLKSIVLPDGLESMGDGTFEDCSSLTDITWPDGMESTYFGAFGGCTGLKTLSFPGSVKTIEAESFEGCTGLESVNFSELTSLENIENDAFKDCSSLTSAEFPASLKRIRQRAFQGCSNLHSVTLLKTVTTVEDDAFTDCASDFTIDTPDYSSGFYYATRNNIPITHDYGEWVTVTEATEDSEGLMERVCANCGQKETKVIPKLAPDYGDQLTEIQSQVNANKAALDALDGTYATDADVNAKIEAAKEAVATAQAAIDAAQNAKDEELVAAIAAAKNAATDADAQTLNAAKAYTDEVKGVLQGQITANKNALDALDGTYATDTDVADKIAAAKTAIETAQAAIDAAQNADISDLNDAVENAKTAAAAADADTLAAAKAYTDAAVTDLKGQIDANKSVLDALDSTYATDADVAAKIDAAKTAVESAQKLIDDAQDAELESLSDAIDEAREATETAKTETLTLAKAYTDTAVSGLQTQVTANKNALDALDSTYATDADVAAKIAAAKTAIESAQAAIDAAQNDEIDDLAAAVENAVAAAADANSDTLAAAKAYTDTAVAGIQSQVTANKNALDALDGTYATDTDVADKIAAAKTAIETAQAAIDNAQNTNISDLNDAIENAKTAAAAADVDTLAAAKAYTDSAVAGIQSQVTANKNALDALDGTYATDEDVAAKIAAAKTAIESAQSAADALQDTEIGNLKTALAEAKTAAESADAATLTAAKAYTDEVKGVLQGQITANKDALDALDGTYATDEDVAAKIAAAKTAIESAQKLIDDAQDAAQAADVTRLTNAIEDAKTAAAAADADTLAAAKAYTDTAVAGIQTQVTANKNALDALDETYATDADVAAKIAAAKTAIAAAQKLIDDAQDADISELSDAIENAKTAAAAADADTLTAAKAYTDTAVAGIQTQVTANRNALDALDGTYATDADVAAKITAAKTAIESAQAAADALQDTEIGNLKTALAEAKTAVESADAATLTAAKAYTDEVKGVLQGQIDTNTEAIGKLDETYATDEDVAAKIAVAKTAIESAQAAADALQDTEIGNLRAALQDAIDAGERANTATLEAANAYTDEKCGALQKQIDELKKEIVQNNINTISVDLTAKANGETAADISWSTSKIKVSGNTVKYSLYYKKATADKWELLYEGSCAGDGKAMTYSATGLTTGTEYQFYVVPSIEMDETIYTGSESVTASVTPKKAAAPAAPSAAQTKAKVVKGASYTVATQTYKVTKVAAGTAPGTVTFTKAKNAKKVTVPKTVKLADGKIYNVTAVGAKAFTAGKVRTVTVEANVTKLTKKAFAKSKATKMIVKTKKLRKAGVKGSLKSSKVKTVQVRIGSKKANKKMAKKYRKIFTKKNAGKKVKVK